MLGAWLMLLLLFCDAIYPFRPTLDVSEVWHTVKAARALLGAPGLNAHPWHYWLVLRIGVYAVLTALLAAGSRRQGRSRWLAGACWATAFATAVEALKFFFSARNPNYANVLMSAGGALAALALGPALARAIPRRGKFILAACLLAGYTAYLEWTPFTFHLDWDFIHARLAACLSWGPHWLPFYEYALGGRGENVFLFVRWLVLLGSLAFAVRFAAWGGRAGQGKWAGVLRGALLAAVVGVAVEAVKAAVPGRFAAVTTVYCFAIGGALGGWVASRHQARLLRAGQSTERDRRDEI
jgi:VanZ family protein